MSFPDCNQNNKNRISLYLKNNNLNSDDAKCVYKLDMKNDTCEDFFIFHENKFTNDPDILSRVVFIPNMKTRNDIYFKMQGGSSKVLKKEILLDFSDNIQGNIIINPDMPLITYARNFSSVHIKPEITFKEFDFVKFTKNICLEENYDRNSIFRIKHINRKERSVCFYKTTPNTEPYQDIYFPVNSVEKTDFPTYDTLKSKLSFENINNDERWKFTSNTNTVLAMHIPTGKKQILKIENKTLIYYNFIYDVKYSFLSKPPRYVLSESYYTKNTYYAGDVKLENKDDYEIIQNPTAHFLKIECKKIKGFPILLSSEVPDHVKCETIVF